MYILFSGRASCSSRDVRRAVVYRHKNVLARARRSELARPKNEVSRFCYETWCVAYQRGASPREEVWSSLISLRSLEFQRHCQRMSVCMFRLKPKDSCAGWTSRYCTTQWEGSTHTVSSLSCFGKPEDGISVSACRIMWRPLYLSSFLSLEGENLLECLHHLHSHRPSSRAMAARMMWHCWTCCMTPLVCYQV